MRRVLLPLLLLALATGLGWAVLRQRGEGEEGGEREEEAIVAPARVGEVNGEAAVVLDDATEQRIGLRIEALRRLERRAEVELPGEVVADPGAASTLRAPVAGRLAVAPGARWPALGERVEGGAELAQVSDARPLAVPRTGVVTSIGAQPGELVQAGQPLLEVTDYSRPLVRIAWSPEAPADAPGSATLLPSGRGGPRVPARLVGPAAEVDRLTRLPAYLYRAERPWAAARPGAPVLAAVPAGGRVEGVLIPEAAVVQWEGLSWVYVRRAPGSYVRTRVRTDRPVPDGWLVSSGAVGAGDTVVLTGAEQLLSEEFRARVSVGEEVGE